MGIAISIAVGMLQGLSEALEGHPEATEEPRQPPQTGRESDIEAMHEGDCIDSFCPCCATRR